MEVLYPRCAGVDVHSRRVNACVRIADGRTVTTEHREFATTTVGLLELAAWLSEAGCTHVAMEATGVYWKPVWLILEDEESLTRCSPTRSTYGTFRAATKRTTTTSAVGTWRTATPIASSRASFGVCGSLASLSK